MAYGSYAGERGTERPWCMRAPSSGHPSSGERDVRLTPVALGLAVTGVMAFAINFLGAAGGHCDESCSGNFPYWLYAGSGWVVVLCVVSLIAVGVIALVRRVRRS